MVDAEDPTPARESAHLLRDPDRDSGHNARGAGGGGLLLNRAEPLRHDHHKLRLLLEHVLTRMMVLALVDAIVLA